MRNFKQFTPNEKIELNLPVNSAYVSAARLTASSISNRMGFKIEEIEDIKSAVSEACIFVIKKCQEAGRFNFHIEFLINSDNLEVLLIAQTNPTEVSSQEDAMGIKMIEALMNKMEISIEDEDIKIKMCKIKS